MKYMPIDQVVQGEYLAKPIFASDGRALLEENVLLTFGLLSRLRQMGITALYIKDSSNPEIMIDEEDVISQETKREAASLLSTLYQYVQSGEKDFKLKAVSKVASSIIDEITLRKEVLAHLNDIRTKDNALFLHSFNVCVLSVLVGLKMGLDRSKLRDLSVGALLHDIGKTTPDQPGYSSKENDHTWKGFNLLRKNPEVSKLSAVVALQHHEHPDGSGYPRSLTEGDIHLFSKIVAVTNDYDNMIYGATGDKPLFPYEACEKIMALTNLHYDHETVWNFLRSVAFYPNGSHVKLTTGETGVVVSQNRGLPQRPIVKVFKSSFHIDDSEVKEVNLAKETTVFIDKMI
ncbi:metal-dependent phosphohydrolase [Bacillus sp. V3-13]|uniref:HD-GYP domain-containing protein n=1 Tax=Bacillus sp. V3-13 TaxID=2053728 RepID=UPI000C78C7AD|nr:HD domain-containing phosphohydrolase [Bacillus sp. V3-13]PLR77561.1 metal-dependent phosphohydrolase [Bacillus sp. V3-13]